MSAPSLAQPSPSLAAAMAAVSDPAAQARIAAVDAAWYASGGSVVATARALQQPYTQTLRALTSPAYGHMSPDDPRVFAHAMAMANITEGTSPVRSTPKAEIQIAGEKTAMQQLAKAPASETARANLTAIAEAEILRDTRLRQIQHTAAPAEGPAKARKPRGDDAR